MSDRPPLLGPDDPPPYRVLGSGPRAAPILLVCDHAASAVPRSLGSLGLSPDELRRHIAWDIGAAVVTERLSDLLSAEAILASFSRLVIDCNRALDDPTSIAEASDGTLVPGNLRLDAGNREARITAIHRPYHEAIAASLDRFAARGVAPALLSVHSFTPRMDGLDRPWHIGVLWDDDPRIALPLMRELSRDPALVVGDNEPYTARDAVGFTMCHHAVARGLPHVMLEIRQDEIASDDGAGRYAGLIFAALQPILGALVSVRTR
jgi:predicted N-formylglutamate amidohydrolase